MTRQEISAFIVKCRQDAETARAASRKLWDDANNLIVMVNELEATLTMEDRADAISRS